MSREIFTVIALAGGLLDGSFRRAGYNVTNKAYIPLGGEPMMVRVLRALRNAGAVNEIRLVTQSESLASASAVQELYDAVIEPGKDLIGSVVAGLSGLPDDDRVLVCATDLALLTADAVDGFASLAALTRCDAGYGFVERAAHIRKYPTIRHTWVRLREGTFCGGGLSVLRVGAVKEIQAALRLFTDARKSPAQMASLLSGWLVLRLPLGRVSVSELEQRASKLTGVVCRGLLCPYPEIAVNVDRMSDLRAVEQIIADSRN
jgi:GTP:adenosylcobinamide-phosphate guanylyltransferase